MLPITPPLAPKKSRCWAGYEPVPGKKAYSKGSCRKVTPNEVPDTPPKGKGKGKGKK